MRRRRDCRAACPPGDVSFLTAACCWSQTFMDVQAFGLQFGRTQLPFGRAQPRFGRPRGLKAGRTHLDVRRSKPPPSAEPHSDRPLDTPGRGFRRSTRSNPCTSPTDNSLWGRRTAATVLKSSPSCGRARPGEGRRRSRQCKRRALFPAPRFDPEILRERATAHTHMCSATNSSGRLTTSESGAGGAPSEPHPQPTPAWRERRWPVGSAPRSEPNTGTPPTPTPCHFCDSQQSPPAWARDSMFDTKLNGSARAMQHAPGHPCCRSPCRKLEPSTETRPKNRPRAARSGQLTKTALPVTTIAHVSSQARLRPRYLSMAVAIRSHIHMIRSHSPPCLPMTC